ncbi:MAG: ExeM/NucH family extracellular endonuclease [Acidimicrobiales bacterium]
MLKTRLLAPLAMAVMVGGSALVPAATTPAGALAADTPIVISQVYGGGGNSGAPFMNDYVELFNRSAAPASLSGLSIQYTSATGAGNFGANSGQLTELPDVTLQPGQHYLVQQAGGSTGSPLPTPDLVDPTPIAMAAGSGKVALVDGATSLGCNGGTAPCDGTQQARIRDLVGYGGADFFEGTGAAPGLSNTTAALRTGGGCADTNVNAADFTAGSPVPRTTASPAASCTGGGGEPEPPEEPVDPDLCEADGLIPINAVQGAGDETPIAGQQVLVRGVVTADFTSGGASGQPNNQGLRGFFIEAIATDRDDDPLTSEGLFVFEPAGTFAGKLGDLVHVAGTAGEFSTVTQVAADGVAVCTESEVDTTLPPAVALPLPVAPDRRAEVFEPLESMRVVHPELTVVEFFQLERFGEVRLSASGVLDNPTNVVDPRDDAAYQAVVAANAAAIIVLDDGRTGQNLDPLPYVVPGGTLRIGDQLRDEPAVLHFGFGQWRLQPTDIAKLTAAFPEGRTRPRPPEPPAVGGSLRVASFNVLNYFDGDGAGGGFPNARGAVTASELARQTEKIVAAVVTLDADIVGLIEIENDGGGQQATRTLVEAINAELDEAHRYDLIDTGVIGTDAIKVALIYRPAVVEPVGPFALLDSTVDARFDDDRNRPVLAQSFVERANGQRLTVAVNHLKSKGSGCGEGDDDPRQGNCNVTRTLAAEAMVDWLSADPTGAGPVATLLVGDLNAYAQEDPVRAFQTEGYVDLLGAYAPAGRVPYTFTFAATQGYLDHALIDPVGRRFVTGAAAWNINADEVPAIDYLESVGGVPVNQRFRTADVAERFYDPSAYRSSDHDPVLVGLDLGRRPTSRAECLDEGWRLYAAGYRNQGLCVASVSAPPGRPRG